MTRTARHIETNGFYHIISRSLNNTRIIQEQSDFTHFINLIRTAKQKYPIRLFHYVIMNTHFHMVIQALSHKILSQNIAYLKWHYTLWMRKKYGWNGPLWKERYKSLPIENENYLYACGTYIEYNPVRAGICNTPGNYPFSSYRKYHLGINDSLIDNYEPDIHYSKSLQLDYCSELTKNIFSRSWAIGSFLFMEKFKHNSNACPQK